MTGTTLVPRTRVLLVGMPRMQSDIISELLKEDPDCEVVGEVPGRVRLLDVVRERQPDVVVIGLRDTDVGPDWDQMFVEHPRLCVMAVTPDGRRAAMFSEPVPRDLLAALRPRSPKVSTGNPPCE